MVKEFYNGSPIIMIACIASNNVIGFKGTLPWKKQMADMERFRRKTSLKSVIMGRKTFESLKQNPLPARQNIVLTRDKDFVYNYKNVKKKGGVDFAFSIKDALLKADRSKEVYIIGGSEIYKQFLPYATHLDLTHLYGVYDKNDSKNDFAYFPKVNSRKWKTIEYKNHPKDSNNELDYTFEVLVRKDFLEYENGI
jgi:dihydrofolate reductase